MDTLENAADDEKFMFDLLLSIFHNSPDAIIIVDESRVIFRANPQAELLFGYTEGQLKGEPIEILLPDALKSKHQEHTKRYSEEPRTRSMGHGLELKAKRRNGDEIPVEINLSPKPTEKGIFVIAIIRKKHER